MFSSLPLLLSNTWYCIPDRKPQHTLTFRYVRYTKLTTRVAKTTDVLLLVWGVSMRVIDPSLNFNLAAIMDASGLPPWPCMRPARSESWKWLERTYLAPTFTQHFLRILFTRQDDLGQLSRVINSDRLRSCDIPTQPIEARSMTQGKSPHRTQSAPHQFHCSSPDDPACPWTGRFP